MHIRNKIKIVIIFKFIRENKNVLLVAPPTKITCHEYYLKVYSRSIWSTLASVFFSAPLPGSQNLSVFRKSKINL